MAIPVETFFLDPGHHGTKQGQVQSMVAAGILSGRFRAGEKLPSSRALAAHLGVSRITVTLAYNELLADDYLTSRGRSGYYISPNAPRPPKFQRPVASGEGVDWTRAIGQRFSGVTTLTKPQDWRRYPYPFIYGQVDETLFDHRNWRQCALMALGQRDFEALTDDQFDADDPKLVEFIARNTLPRRGIVAGPEEILVTMGAQNALWLAAQVLLTQRRTAAVEDPCYPSLRAILAQSRCHMRAVQVNARGLPPEAVPEGTNVVFTTPSHQCPTTATMPLDRRKALLRRASDEDWLVVEDDYEFEMSFLKPPLPALKSLDTEGRVIYVGSFSKSLFPGLRLGYLVGAAPFIREARALRSSVLRHPPGLMQRTAAHFMSLGHFDALIRRTSRAFADRRIAMESAIRRHGLTVAGEGAGGGSSLWMEAPAAIDTVELDAHLRTRGVLIEPGAAFFGGDHPPRRFFRLAYSSIPASRIETGVAHIAAAMRELT